MRTRLCFFVGRIIVPVVALVLALSLPVWADSTPVPNAGEITTVLLIRHAEREEQGDNPSLLPEGEARAQQLVHVAGWAGVKAIYSTNWIRTKATVDPLAKCLGITPIDYSTAAEVAQKLTSQHAGQVVLVVSHDGVIQEIIDALAGANSSLPGDSAYDSLTVLTLYAPAKVSILRLKYGRQIVAQSACAEK